ncbi:unnamed protein product [Moneuplotes crassus]|uniref:VTT domain-containing protein n=1 Tax=Euplotes crassus TaxID=5936 RepID=A0AAD2D535_EUPCR|nr:unnamed protein product [Moneuplotes crassus]
MEWNSKIVKFFLYVIITFILSTVLTTKIMAEDYLEYTRDIILANYRAGVAVYFAVAVAITVTGVPFGFLDMINVYIFPFPLSVIIMFTEKTIGSAITYKLASSLTENSKKEYLKVDLIKRVNTVIKNSPVFYGTMIRLSAIPAAVKNYGLASLEISFTDFMTASFVGSLITIPIKTYINYQLIDIYEQMKKGDVNLPTGNLFLAIVALLSMGITVRKIIKTNTHDQIEVKKNQ